MEQNESSLDRVARFVLGVVLLIWGIYASSWWGLLAIPLLYTSGTGYCHLYKILGINTKR